MQKTKHNPKKRGFDNNYFAYLYLQMVKINYNFQNLSYGRLGMVDNVVTVTFKARSKLSIENADCMHENITANVYGTRFVIQMRI